MRYALLLLLIAVVACAKTEPAASSTTETETKPATEPAARPGTQDEPEGAEPSAVPINAKPSEPDSDEAPETFADALPEFGPPEIELLEAGSPPLKKLSWQFKKGSQATAKISNSMSVEMVAGTNRSPETSAPSTSFSVSLDTVEVSPDGSAKVAFKIDDAEVDRESSHEVLVEQQMTASDKLKGATGTYSIDSTGTIGELAFDEPVDPRGAEMADDFKRMLRLATISVPSEKIGVGAKWLVEQVVEQGGVRLRERRVYKVSELNGSRVVLDATVQAKAPPQTVRIPGQGSRRTYQLLGYKAEGSQKLSIDLTQLAPGSLDSKVLTTQRIIPEGQVAGGAGTNAIQLKMNVNTVLTRK